MSHRSARGQRSLSLQHLIHPGLKQDIILPVSKEIFMDMVTKDDFQVPLLVSWRKQSSALADSGMGATGILTRY